MIIRNILAITKITLCIKQKYLYRVDFFAFCIRLSRWNQSRPLVLRPYMIENSPIPAKTTCLAIKPGTAPHVDGTFALRITSKRGLSLCRISRRLLKLYVCCVNSKVCCHVGYLSRNRPPVPSWNARPKTSCSSKSRIRISNIKTENNYPRPKHIILV